MSCNYAEGLSPYEHKGILGIPEKFEPIDKFNEKCEILSQFLRDSKHVVVHTGAGISTSAGIPDFRGPNGVWTLEKQGRKPTTNVSFAEALPTKTHMILKKLVECGKVHYIVSQNIDGLHLKSGLPRKYLSELHGNMFVDECNLCKRQFVRSRPVETVGKKCSGVPCASEHITGRPCRGRLYDGVLDWEHSLPENDLLMAEWHSSIADLSICLGTTLQIIPSGNLPLETAKYGGKLVLCNLQPTKHVSNYKHNNILFAMVLPALELKVSYSNQEPYNFLLAEILSEPDKRSFLEIILYIQSLDVEDNLTNKKDNKADLVINYYVDDILEKVMNILGIEIPEYNVEENPTKCAETAIIDWTISRKDVITLEKIFKAKCKGVKKKRILIKSKQNSFETSVTQNGIKSKRNRSEMSLNGVGGNESKVVKLDIKAENDIDTVNSEERGTPSLELKNEPILNGENVDEQPN